MTIKHPLEGIRVLALEQYIAGPDCTMWLADNGAEVIKIERPAVGDPRRNYEPIVADEKGNKAYGGFMVFNRNKKSCTLNLQTEQGKKTFRELVRHADVIVENMAPGTLERLGLGYKDLNEINPRLIYAAISGFGRLKEFEGPYAKWPAFDPAIQAMSGIMDQIGVEDGPPQWGFPGLADIFTGVVTGYSIALALFMREKTGEGQFIDSSMYDSLVSLNEMGIMFYTFSKIIAKRGGLLRYQAPAGVYKVKDDKYIAFLAANEFIWERFCKAIDREDLISNPKTSTGPNRVKNKDFLEPIVISWFESKTRDEAVDILLKNGVPVGPVQSTEDLVNCPHLKARGMLLEIDDPIAKQRVFARSPIRMSNTKEVVHKTAPVLGADTDSILKDLLNYDQEMLDELRKDKII